jgi:hypothetical protein
MSVHVGGCEPAKKRIPCLEMESTLDPMLGDGDLESERPNSLLANLVDAILPGLGVGTFHEPV